MKKTMKNYSINRFVDCSIVKRTLAVAGMTMGLAFGAQAETIKDVKYIDANGIEQTCAEATLVTKDTETITGWCVVTGTVERTTGINVRNAAHLILADGCSLKVQGDYCRAGIEFSADSGYSLAIYGQSLGTGELSATGGEEGAGIGGESNEGGQNITINGGTVTARGGENGAGIGGGNYSGCSNITINGGTVTATGGNGAAAIGNGAGASSAATNIKVNPLMLLKAGASAASTEVATDRTRATDVANDLAGKRYATAKIDYNIALKNGEAYRGYADDSRKITARVASMGLTYAGDNVWTMSNFVFRTNKAGLRLNDANTTIVVIGTNSISTGNAAVSECYALYCLEDGTTGIIIKGAETGDNTLTITAPYDLYDGGSSTIHAIEAKSLSVEDNVTVIAAAGYSPDGTSAGVSANRISVSGTGKLIAKADATVENAKAVDSYYKVEPGEPDVPPTFEPDATATDAEDKPLTWVWTSKSSYYEGTYTNESGNVATYAILTAPVPPTPIPSKVTEIANTTYAVYTNGVLSADGTVLSNKTATVVYTANAGYVFATGEKEVTIALDTSVNPAVNKAGEVVPPLGKPVVQLGIVAQRYPWDGTIDVGYRATYVKNTPAVVKVVANGVEYTQEVTISSGTNTVAFTAIPSEIRAKDAKVTIELK